MFSFSVQIQIYPSCQQNLWRLMMHYTGKNLMGGNFFPIRCSPVMEYSLFEDTIRPLQNFVKCILRVLLK